MFLKDFLKHFAGSPDNYWVNVHLVDKLGHTFFIRTTDEVDEVNDKIASLKEDLEGEIQWRKELQREVEDKTGEISELESIVSKFDGDGVTVKEIVSQNGELIRQIAEWRKNSLDLEAKIRKLQGRKNKTTVERDYKTGQFVVEYQGVKYNLVKF